jgi:hypothetical protein
LCRGTATADQITAARVASGEGQRWESQEGNKPHLFEALGWEGEDRGGLLEWHKADGGCGWWWWRSGEEKDAGTGRAASG